MLKRNISSTILASLAIASMVSTNECAAADSATEKKESKRPHIDLAFCIDTTGSMAGEINNVKAKTKEIVAKLAGGKPAPIVRVGLVAYRDRGDQYVTKVFQFSEDIDKVVKDISSLEANGGGDTPESVNEAVHVAVNDLHWDGGKSTLKMLFLIGDAGPHEYAHDYNWRDEAKTAISHGIQINTVGCHGIEGTGAVDVFTQIAKLTDGKYEPLSYHSEIATAGGGSKTIISSAGKTYEVRAKDKDAWRSGASDLAKTGAITEMPASSAAFAAPRLARFAATGAGMPSGMPMAMPASAAAVDRGDSNLADMVLKQTRSAAQKKLGIDFQTK
jgi:Mg-chelatase subunit ChlD